MCYGSLLRALVLVWVPFPGTSSLMSMTRKMQILLVLTLTATATGSGRPRSTSTVRAFLYGPPRNLNPRFGDQNRAPLTSPAPAPSPLLRFGAGAGAAAAQQQRDTLTTRSRVHGKQDMPSCSPYTLQQMGNPTSGSPEVPPLSASLPVQPNGEKVRDAVPPLPVHASLQLSMPVPKVVRLPVRLPAAEASCDRFGLCTPFGRRTVLPRGGQCSVPELPVQRLPPVRP